MSAGLFNKQFNKEIFSANNVFLFCLALFPVLTLSLQRWISVFLFVAFGTALYILYIKSKPRAAHVRDQVDAAWLKILLITFTAPVVAIGLGQIFRQEFILPSFDNASRFLLVVPITLVIVRNRINAFKLLEYAIPATVLATALSVLLHPNFKYAASGADRVTTYFVDPLTFGSVSLALALFSLSCIDCSGTDSWVTRLYKLAGFFVGIFMSFSSGSRTGWMALPIVLWLWLRFRKNIPHWIILTLVTLFCVGVYFLVPVVAMRIDVGVNQLLHYHWNGMNADDPIESRITFFRIGWFLFAHNPLGGWGDVGFKHLLDAPELQRFASESIRIQPFHAGFHNEIVTNMVRSGIWGLASSVALFFVPIALFFAGLRSPSERVRNHALIGIGYMICVLVSAMSTEVFNLKFTAAFHAFMIASLTGSILVLMSTENNAKNL